MEEHEIKEFFEECGELAEIKILKGGKAFVQFTTKEDMEKALNLRGNEI